MPPASRGLQFFRFIRQYATVKDVPTSNLPSKTMQVPKGKLPEGTYKPTLPKEEGTVIPPPSPAPPPKISRFDRLRERIPYSYRKSLSRLVLFGPVVGIALVHFPLEIMWTNGGSMSPFFNPNASHDLPENKDKLLIHRFNPGLINAPIARGQIVVFYTPHDPEKIAVKRVVGLPGDRVQPRPRYPGGDEPVVIQYNHLWVEGDIDNRDKSIDSNWYGPISQNLVIGSVVALLEPWYRPTRIDLENHTYPAKKSGRVEENAVARERLNPDEQDKDQAFVDGRAERELEKWKENRNIVAIMLRNEASRQAAVQLYEMALREADKQHPDTIALAEELTSELESAFVMAGLTKFGQMKLKAPAAEDVVQDDGEEGEAKRKLREYLARQKKSDLVQSRNSRPVGIPAEVKAVDTSQRQQGV